MENLLAETLADGYSYASMRISSIAHYAHEEKITQPILSIAVIRGPIRPESSKANDDLGNDRAGGGGDAVRCATKAGWKQFGRKLETSALCEQTLKHWSHNECCGVGTLNKLVSIASRWSSLPKLKSNPVPSKPYSHQSTVAQKSIWRLPIRSRLHSHESALLSQPTVCLAVLA
jgi:hypothetical protein